MAEFDKLVRDKIPEWIEKEGRRVDVEVLSKENFSKRLDEKLLEECQEVLAASDRADKMEEMADLLEVLSAMCELHEISMSEIEKVRLEKRAQRGGFEKRLLLKKTD